MIISVCFVLFVGAVTWVLQQATTYSYLHVWWKRSEYMLSMGITAIGSGLFWWDWETASFFWLVILSALIHIAIIDWQHQEIADEMNLCLLILGAIGLWTEWGHGSWWSGLLYFGVFFALLILTGAIGGGDVKLMFGVGWLLGSHAFLSFVMMACWIGMAFAVVSYVKTKDRHAHFPFGPALVGSFFWIEWIEPWVRMTFF